MTTDPSLNQLDSGAAAGAPAKLIALSGDDKGAIHSLPRHGDLVLGREHTNNIVVHDTEVSRHHCTIIAHDGAYRLRDVHSTNGSFVDGKRIEEAELRSGSKIRLGQTTFVLVLPDETRPVKAVGVGAGKSGKGEKTNEEERTTNNGERITNSQRQPARSPKARRLIAAAAVLLLVAGAVLAYSQFKAGSPFQLPQATETIAVSSTPTAEVFLDDRFAGPTPARLEVSMDGPHALRLARRGYQTWRTAIGPDSARQLDVKLEPEPAATLFVSASKPDTEVYLDGRFVGMTGNKQPLQIPNVKLGQHELRLQRPNYITHLDQIDVTRTGNLPPIHVKLDSRQESSLLNLIAKEPKSALLYTELGHFCMVEKQFDKAMAAYKNALELVYSDTDTSSYKKRLLPEIQKIVQGAQGDFAYGTEEETRVACEKLENVFIALAPRYPNARTTLTWLANHYVSKNQPEDVIRLYRKMLAAEPDQMDRYYEISTMYLNRGDYENAIEILRQAGERFPGTWSVEYRIGLAYSRRVATSRTEADKRQAVLHFEKALQLCKTDGDKRSVQYYLDKVRELKTE